MARSSSSATSRAHGTSPSATLQHHVASLHVERPMVESCLASHMAPRALLALCCEPGMGVGDALDRALELLADRHPLVHRLDLSDTAGADCAPKAARLHRKARAEAREGMLTLVLLEDVPDLGEEQVTRMAGVVRRMLDGGACVVLTMRPEAVQLLEELRSALVFWSEDLLVEARGGTGACLDDGGVALCRGIPLLVWGYLRAPRTGEGPGRGYVDAMAQLVPLSMRAGLMEEERRLRLAMMALGSGRVEELEGVLGRVDAGILRAMQRDAPLFGVDVATSTFCCAGLSSLSVLEPCAFALAPLGRGREKVLRRCAEALMRRGEPRRAALLAALLPDDDAMAGICLRWCVELADVGRLDLVRSALGREAAAGTHARSRRAAELVADACRGGRVSRERVEELLAAGAETDGGERHACLMAALLASGRLLMAGVEPPAQPPVPEGGGRLARRLSSHLDAVRLMVAGRFREAYRHLLETPSEATEGSTLSAALLATDRALAGTLALDPKAQGSVARVDWGLLGQARGLVPYLGVSRAVACVAGGGSFGWSPKAAAHADRSGDALLRSWLLMLSALSEAHDGGGVMAHVRASNAESIARRLAVPWLGEACRIVSWAVAAHAGERPAADDLRPAEFSTVGLASIARVVALAGSEGGSACVPPDLPLDRDHLWLLCALAKGLGGVSEAVRRGMPPSWRRVVEEAGERWVSEGPEGPANALRRSPQGQGGPSAHEGQAAGPGGAAAGAHGPTVEVRVLGGMEVLVNGSAVPEGLLARRRGKAMLSFVATLEGHSAQRYRLAEALWPEGDLAFGRKGIYQATSAVNRALREAGSDVRPFRRSSSECTIALDLASVHCDLDDFLLVGRRALAGGRSDEEVLADARSAAGLYAGDLYVSSYDTSGEMALRRDEVRALFLDVMVAGSAAAGRLRAFGSAIYLAERAVRMDDLREDAHACLLGALIASGREAEALSRYAAFSMRCVERLRRPPSRRLRDMVEGIASPASRDGAGTLDYAIA